MTVKKPKRERTLTRASIRALPQNQSLTEEEFEQKFNVMLMEKAWDKDTKEKFDKILQDFEESYDLSEMLPNDRIVLSNLIQAMINLDNYDNYLRQLMKIGITDSNLQIFKEVNNICKTLRSDISSMQDDLNITRKRRKNEKEASVINFLEDLKEKARKFYAQKMQLIFCENCNSLLATVWWLYPESRKQVIRVRCERETDGKMCGFEKSYTAKELLDMGMRNKEDIPDSLK